MSNPQIEELRKRYEDNLIRYDDIGILFNCIDTLDKLLRQANVENEKLQIKIDEKELIIDGMKEDRRIAIEEIRKNNFISKAKIKEKIEFYKEKCVSDSYNKGFHNTRVDVLEELLEV